VFVNVYFFHVTSVWKCTEIAYWVHISLREISFVDEFIELSVIFASLLEIYLNLEHLVMNKRISVSYK
jgi:hypothetical protein